MFKDWKALADAPEKTNTKSVYPCGREVKVIVGVAVPTVTLSNAT
jgi:hypothetical protein